MGRVGAILLGLLLSVSLSAQEGHTEVTKWQDGKQSAISLTFDDSTENHFRIAMPLMNERGMKGTFFIITGEIPGSRYQPAFIGRPPMDIIRESQRVPTNQQNVLERTSLLRYLKEVQGIELLADFNQQRAGRAYERKQFAELFPAVDAELAKLRQSGATYTVHPILPPGKYNMPRWHTREGISWDAFRRYAAQGHEFASHTVSHPYMSALDEANSVYEIETSIREIGEQLGHRHTFSIECPNGIADMRLLPYLEGRVSLSRNWVTDPFMDGILRGDDRDPATSTKEYVQWQRGPRSKTPFSEMTGWVDKSLQDGLWLVLVFHGIDDIGWEPLTTKTFRDYLDYMRQREDRIWVATFQDAAKYARERVSSKVESKRVGGAIEVSVRHTLDPKLYDLPLTARTMIPADWPVVRFHQGANERWLPVHREGNEAYVLYQIAPDGTTARLEAGAK